MRQRREAEARLQPEVAAARPVQAEHLEQQEAAAHLQQQAEAHLQQEAEAPPQREAAVHQQPAAERRGHRGADHLAGRLDQ